MPKARAYAHKVKVLSRVDRESDEVRLVAIDDLISAKTLLPILEENIAKEV